MPLTGHLTSLTKVVNCLLHFYFCHFRLDIILHLWAVWAVFMVSKSLIASILLIIQCTICPQKANIGCCVLSDSE